MLDVCFGGGMEDTVYVNCSFDRSAIEAVAPGSARFVSCSFRNINIVEVFANWVEMIDCTISGLVRKAIFCGKVPKESASSLGRIRNRFEGNDFSDARLLEVEFMEIDLSLQRMPAGWKN